MWRNLEVEAIKVGLDLYYFWNLTPKQFEKHIQMFNENERKRITEVDMLNHLLGKYIAIAFNDPKNYPNRSFLDKSNELIDVMTDEEMELRARRNTIKMGGVINEINDR